MPRAALAVLIVLLAAAAAPATARADTVSCDPGEYQLLHGENPTIASLKAHNLPRRTDGYAPRRLVAEAIAAEIQRTLQEGGEFPRRVTVYGARWNGGTWRCRYPGGDRASCRKRGKPERRVTMRLI
jgi:hypothetical protein